MKFAISEDLAITLIVMASGLSGFALVLVPALLIGVWDVAPIGLAVGTLFFALAGLRLGFIEGGWRLDNLAIIMAPFLVTAAFLGVVAASGVTMIITAMLERYNPGALCVVILIAMLPVGLVRESFRKLSEDKPSRRWVMAAWIAPAAVLDTLMWFRPDLLRLPEM